MKDAIYIRPLALADAKVSYLWRNDPDIWLYTEFKPNQYITSAMEEEWLQSKLEKPDEKRFAICLTANDQYIGNVQLLNITKKEADYHIFLGEKNFWGRGISQSATQLVLALAFSRLNLENVFLEVNPLNIAACSLYIKAGFATIGENALNGFLRMRINRKEFERC